MLGKVFVCEYCLKYMKSATILRRHMVRDKASTVFILHSSFNILYSAFFIQHFSFNSFHSTFFIQHSSFNSFHSTFFIQHSSFNIFHSTFFIQHFSSIMRPSKASGSFLDGIVIESAGFLPMSWISLFAA